MNDWNQFTQNLDLKTDLPDAALEGQAQVCDLGHLGFLSVEGDDAASFLQGQLTNDVLALEESQFQLSGYCTPKGRLLAVFHLIKCSETTFLMQMPKALLKPTQTRLSLFVLNAAVTITDVSDSLVSIGVQTSDMGQLVTNWPTTVYGGSVTDGLRLLHHPGTVARAEIIATPSALIDASERFSTQFHWQSTAFWIAANIRAGIPTIYEPTVDAFTPQMVNMELTNGVSFSKGCYPGQEIVARTQYLGKIKRRMHAATIDITTPPSPGSLILNDTDGTDVGTVIDATYENGQVTVGFVAKSDSMESPLYLQESTNKTLTLLPLPYEVEL